MADSRAWLAIGLALWAMCSPARADSTDPTPYPRVETGVHQAVINRMALLPGGESIVTVSDDKTARIWRADTLQPAGVILPPIGPGDDGALDAVAATGKVLAVGGRIRYGAGFAVQFYRLPDLKLIGHRSELPAPVSALRFTPDGHTLAVGMIAGRGLGFVDLRTGEATAPDTAYTGQVQWIDIDPQGRTVASGEDGRIRLYGADHHKLAPDATLPDGGKPYAVAFSPDGRLIAVGIQNRAEVWLLDGATLHRVRRLAGVPGRLGGFAVVAFAPGGGTLFAAGSYKAGPATPRLIRHWALSGTPASEFPAGGDTVTDLIPIGDDVLASDGEPVIQRIGATGQTLAERAARHIDFRDAGLGGFAVSRDGGAVELPLGGDGHWVFDARMRTLARTSEPSDLAAPAERGGGLQASLWRNTTAPHLNGTPVALEKDEVSLAVAVAPDGSGAAIGTNFHVRFQRRDGTAWRTVVPSPAWAVNVSGDGREVIAGLGDGTVRWFDAAGGNELLSLFLDPASRHWVLATPEGFFDHDPADPAGSDGRSLIGYRFNDPASQVSRFVEIGQLYPLFYRPDLVGLALRDDPAARRAIEDARERQGAVAAVLDRGLPAGIALQEWCGAAAGDSACSPARPADTADPPRHPEAQLATTAASVLVRFRLSNPAGLPGRVAIFRNAAAISPPLVTLAEDAHTRIQAALIPLGDGANALRLLPVSGNGEVEASASAAAALTVWHEAPPPAAAVAAVPGPSPGTPNPESPARALFLLSVGVSTFSNAVLNLDNASNDASAVAALMETPDPKVYDVVHVTTLLDGQATVPRIVAELKTISEQARPDDLVVLFFAGHGEEVDGRYYFAPADIGTRNPELFQRALSGGPDAQRSIDQLFRTEGLGPDQILPLIQATKAARVAVVLDTCYSASLATQDIVFQRDANSTITNSIGHATGRFVLSSATTLALDAAGASGAIPQDGKGHGLFTSYLLEALQGKADLLHAGRVDVVQLARYTIDNVTRATASMKQKQEPTFFFSGSDFFALRSDGLNP